MKHALLLLFSSKVHGLMMLVAGYYLVVRCKMGLHSGLKMKIGYKKSPGFSKPFIQSLNWASLDFLMSTKELFEV